MQKILFYFFFVITPPNTPQYAPSLQQFIVDESVCVTDTVNESGAMENIAPGYSYVKAVWCEDLPKDRSLLATKYKIYKPHLLMIKE